MDRAESLGLRVVVPPELVWTRLVILLSSSLDGCHCSGLMAVAAASFIPKVTIDEDLSNEVAATKLAVPLPLEVSAETASLAVASAESPSTAACMRMSSISVGRLLVSNSFLHRAVNTTCSTKFHSINN